VLLVRLLLIALRALHRRRIKVKAPGKLHSTTRG